MKTLIFLSTISLAFVPWSRALELEARQITHGPQHHFFGYIGHVQNIPWNKSGRYILALRTGFQDRMPRKDDVAEIVLLDTAHDYEERVVERTRAWNPQQGTMLYWNPQAQETQFFFNDRDPATGRVFTVLFDVSAGEKGKRVREYRFDDTPVGNSGVAQKGGWFAAINYARLARLRAVTGYPETFDWTTGVVHPKDDGIFRVNVDTGERRLIMSFDQLAEVLRPKYPGIDAQELFINHTLSNRDSDRIYFFVRADFYSRTKKVNEPFFMDIDGGGLTPLKQFIGGHPEWDSGHRMIGAVDKQQVIYDTDKQEVVGVIGSPEVLPEPEGDISLSPDGHWLVNGSRKDSRNRYTFVRRSDNSWVKSDEFDVTGWTAGDLRCDPAPCWNRESNQIVFPAIAGDAGKSRQMFLIRVKE
jgi:hypothetical protein